MTGLDHRFALLPGSRRSPVKAVETEEFAESVPDIDARPDAFPVATFDLAPGDCTVHHANTLHSSGGNRTPDRTRRAVNLRYAGDDARYTVHDHAMRTVDPGLKAGDPLGGEHCPQVWPQVWPAPR